MEDLLVEDDYVNKFNFINDQAEGHQPVTNLPRYS